MKLLFILFFLQLFAFGYGYKILITVVGLSGSQNLIMYRLAEILGKRGHEVTILKKEFLPEAKTPKLSYSKEIAYNAMKDEDALKSLRSHLNDITWESEQFSMKQVNGYKLMFNTISADCERVLKNKELLNKLKSQNFDVIIIHMFDFCSFGMAEAIGIKATVWMSTAFMVDPMAWYSSCPSNPSYVVSGAHPVTDRMTFLERIKNTIASTFVEGMFQYGVVMTYSEIFKQQFGSDFPTLGQLMHNTQLYFINSDPFFEYPRPTLHNVIYVGGLTMKNAEPLNEEWQKIVDDAGDAGVVVFSFGSVAKTEFMPIDMKNAFIGAFKKIPQTVVWRLEGDTSEARKVPNIRISDWLPQKDLLGHPKVKAFITHGGYNSLTEATYLGVPLVMFPLFGDQHANVKRVERLNVGVTLHRKNLTESSILEALNAVLNSEKVQSNAKRLGRMIRNKPESSHDLAIKWIEFLAEYQNLDQLKPASRDLSLVEYFLLDVYLTILFSFLLISFIIFKCCKFGAKKLCCGGRKHKND